MTLIFSGFRAKINDLMDYFDALFVESASRVNLTLYAKKMTLLLGFPASQIARSKSHIVAFLHVFSPRSTKTFFPIRALFGATSAREWTGLAVLIAHVSFSQQISWSGTFCALV